MTPLALAYLAFLTVSLGTIAFLRIMSPKKDWIRWMAFGLFCVVVSGACLTVTEIAGTAKPVNLEWRSVNKAPVVTALLDEGHAIYLVLLIQKEPRLYQLPWKLETALAIQKAQGEAEENGTSIEVDLGGQDESGDDREPLFYALPVQPGLEKDYSE